MSRYLFLIMTFWLALPAITYAQRSEIQMPSSIAIRANEPSKAFIDQAPSAIKVIKQPAGINFYLMQWGGAQLGDVHIHHGAASVQIPDVRVLQGEEDAQFPEEHIANWKIYIGLSSGSVMSHEQARNKIYAILAALEKKAWRVLIDPDDPRLTGKERFDYVTGQSPASGLNIDYVPTLDEWMRLEDLSHWSFYADGVFLTVTMQRDQGALDVSRPGHYILVLNLMGENEGFRAFVPPKARTNWRNELPSLWKALNERRTQREAQALVAGKKINTSYQDPPLPKR
ncbi:hypothetical protein G5B88_14745 [Herbaspirillum seropedicae]|uniref:Uncharacterized protein n=1 Tax=Herbaspirillum seropedicae (strain SmR1) TaxID=757424 RepID=D8IZR2_HERSS|nr:hypothetical protein [Herbaspirillum seropedicae]ADJ64402.1 conserved hypothetical protein [Herbaspirillum seropedicae SmR1]AKN66333.1 hypothetical protein ACP92_14605 [Herbaspirillum seropedicae]NQE30561.1 hypothetical protein [Herbaspirillum seropedicae]UMU22324.1 hypothetical protein G5B88_14745 [Herbaspirillum seropedicae]